MLEVNGKTYPLWSQFVEKKDEWIGGSFVEKDVYFGAAPQQTITDIRLEPNGEEGALFVLVGNEYSWSCDVECLGIVPNHQSGECITLSATYGSAVSVYKPKEADNV